MTCKTEKIGILKHPIFKHRHTVFEERLTMFMVKRHRYRSVKKTQKIYQAGLITISLETSRRRLKKAIKRGLSK